MSNFDRRLYEASQPGREAMANSRLLKPAWRGLSDSFRDLADATFAPLERQVEAVFTAVEPQEVYEHQEHIGGPAFDEPYAAARGHDYTAPNARDPYWFEPPSFEPEPHPQYPNPADQVFVQHAVDEMRHGGEPAAAATGDGPIIEGHAEHVAPDQASALEKEPLFDTLADEPFFQDGPDRPDPYSRYVSARAGGVIGDPADQVEMESAIAAVAAPLDPNQPQMDQSVEPALADPSRQPQPYADPFSDPFQEPGMFPPWPGFPGGW